MIDVMCFNTSQDWRYRSIWSIRYNLIAGVPYFKVSHFTGHLDFYGLSRIQVAIAWIILSPHRQPRIYKLLEYIRCWKKNKSCWNEICPKMTSQKVCYSDELDSSRTNSSEDFLLISLIEVVTVFVFR